MNSDLKKMGAAIIFGIAFLNGHSQTFTDINVVGFESLTSAKVEWADFDNDGFLDLITTGINATGSSRVTIYFNNGDVTFNSLQVADWSDAAFYLNDYNLDGYLDILLSGISGGIKKTSVFKSLSGGAFTEQDFSLTGLSKSALVWQDLDQDGDLDIVQTGLDSTPSSRIIVYEFDAGNYTEVVQSLNGASSGTLSFFDGNRDGIPELLVTSSENTTVYSVSQSLQFTVYTGSLPGWVFNSTVLLDYNEDGFLDVANTGNFSSGLYRNNQVNGFVSVSPFLVDLASASIDAGDLNNDGLADLFLTGEDNSGVNHAFYYKNSESLGLYSFTSTPHTLSAVFDGDAALGDYDNDGDLDIFQMGNSEPVPNLILGLYASDVAATNENLSPNPPGQLFSTTNEDTVILSWAAGSDDLTHSNSLSYNVYLSQSLDAANLLVSPNSTISTGFRRLIRHGNNGLLRTRKISGLAEGRYYWSVQSIDNGFRGSPFASEENFNICYPFDLGVDVSICESEIVMFSVEAVPFIGSAEWLSLKNGLVGTDFTYSHLAESTDTLVAKVTKTFGCVLHDTIVVNVFELPQFSLGSDTSVCYQETLLLSVADLGIASLDSMNWYSLGGGLLMSNSETLNYQVFETGTLIGEVFNLNGCVSYDTLVTSVFELPHISLGNNTSVCYKENFSVSVTDFGIQGLDSLNWYSRKQGLLIANSEELEFQVLETDTLIAEVFDVNGCIGYDSLIVGVNALPVFNLGNDTSTCYQETLSFSVTDLGIEGSDSLNWYSIKQGLLIANSEDLDFQVLKNDTLIVEVFNVNGCVAYDSLIVGVNALPVFNLGNDTSVCYQETLSVSVTDLGIEGLDSVNWYLPSGELLLANSESLDYQVLKRDTLIAEVFNINGCVLNDTLVVMVYELPHFSLGNDTSVCYQEHLSISVTDLGIVGLDSVNWNLPSGTLLLANSESLDYQILKKDTLFAEVFNVNGCVSSDTIVVGVSELPHFSLGNDTSICFQEYLSISVSELGIVGLDLVNWYLKKRGLLVTNNESLDFQVLEMDTLIAEVFNMNGCVGYDSLIVGVNALPVFNLGNDTLVCYQEYLSVSVTDLLIEGLDSVNWYSSRRGQLIANNESFDFQVLEKDTLVAEVFNVNGCVGYDSLIVGVNTLPVFNLGNDTSVCFQEYFTISVTDLPIEGLDSANWYLRKQGFLEANNESLDYQVLKQDTLIAEVFNVNGCVGYDSLIVGLNALPVFNLGNDTSICYQEYLSISVNDLGIEGLDSVNWHSRTQGLLVTNSMGLNYKVLEKDTLIAEVFNMNGCVGYDSLIVDIHPLPQFTIGKDTSICFGSTLLLDLNDPTFERIQWYSNSRNTVLEVNNWFFNHKALRTDTLVVEVMNLNGCLNQDSIIIGMDPLPVFNIRDMAVCFLQTVTYEIPGEWKQVDWFTFGNQLLESNSKTYTFSIEETQTFWASVRNDKGCLTYDTATVTMLDLPVFDLGDEQVYCEDDKISISAGNFDLEYSWTNRLGESLHTENSWEFTAYEDMELFLQVKNVEGCEYLDSLKITVNPLPRFTIQGNADLCEGDSAQFTVSVKEFSQIDWYTESETALLTEALAYYYHPSQSEYLFAGLTDLGGCSWTDSLWVNVHPLPTAFAGEDSTICFGESVQLGGTYAEEDQFIFQWTGVALSDPTLPNPLANPETTSRYVLLVTDDHGCQALDTAHIHVDPQIRPDAGEDQILCVGDTLQIGGTPTTEGTLLNYSYVWSPTEGLSDPISPNPFVTTTHTITYVLQVTSGHCGLAFDSVSISVHPNPTIELSPPVSVGPNESVELVASGGSSYFWTPSELLDDPFSNRPIAYPVETTVFTVKIADEYGCDTTGSVKVLVQNVLFIPNLFTPNGDGSNDTFLVYGSGIAQINFQVFDLSGKLVYRAESLERATGMGWDGTARGMDLPNGTYIWSLEGVYHDGTELNFFGAKKGTIRLLR